MDMTIETSAYGMRVMTRLPYDDAVRVTREALRQQGFGVITEIDVRKTMQEKLGIDHAPYLILGACNPALAHQAIEAEREIGLLLPCNVIVYAQGEGEGAVIAAMDPAKTMAAVADNPALGDIARQVRGKLEAALRAVAAEQA
jgi:uncharacterized protein (DUF302 family)